jgi:hypothetical protein
MDGHNSVFNWLINGVAIGTIVTTLVGLMPAFAAMAAAIYYLIQAWESETVRRWRADRRRKQIETLKAKLLSLEAYDPSQDHGQKT